MVDYRPLPDSALDRYRAYLSYAFNPTGERFDPEEADELPAPAEIGERRGLFEDDELVAVCAHHLFDTRIRGDWHEMGGLSAVATPPENRRQGLTERMLAETVAEYGNRGLFLAALWPFSSQFYAKYGWATANRVLRQEGPPSAFAFTREQEAGSFFEADPEGWESLQAVRDAHRDGYDLTIDRTEEWWEKRVFQGWQSDPYVYGWEIDGEVEGYLVYTIDETADGDSQIQTWDFGYATHRARLNLLRFLANHEDQIDSVQLTGHPDSLVMDLAPDPSNLSYTLHAGPMIRLTDVVAGLSAISYPEAVEAAVTIEVQDGLADWNDGTFDVVVEDGSGTVTRSDTAPAVTFDVGTLSQLFVGYRSMAELARERDTVTVHSSEAVPDLDAAFPTRSVSLSEHF